MPEAVRLDALPKFGPDASPRKQQLAPVETVRLPSFGGRESDGDVTSSGGEAGISDSPRLVFFRAGPIVKRCVLAEVAQGASEAEADEALSRACLQVFGLPRSLQQLATPGNEHRFTARRFVDNGTAEEECSSWSTIRLETGLVFDVVDPLWRAAILLARRRDDRSLPPAVLEEATRREESIAKGEGQPLARRLHSFLNDPFSSTPALALAVLILFLIVLSTVTFCVETLPAIYRPNGNAVLDSVEAFCIAVFTFELILRFAVAPNRYVFVTDLMNVIDFIAILPFYLEKVFSNLQVPGLAVLRVTRLSRVLRLLKMSKGSLTVLVATMIQSARPLYMLIFLTTIAMILFGSMMFYCERGVYSSDLGVWRRHFAYECPFECSSDTAKYIDGYLGCEYDGQTITGIFSHPAGPDTASCISIKEMSPFNSIPASFWWALTTMTTLGYGDLYPTSPQGKLMGSLTTMFGILVIALPITVVGSNFSNIYESVVRRRTRAQAHKAKRELGLAAASTSRKCDAMLAPALEKLVLELLATATQYYAGPTKSN